MRTSPRNSRSALLAALLAALTLGLATSASADIGETIILRCTHGKSLSGFSQSAYSKALKELGADAEEYTECSQLIRQAQAAAARGGGGGAPGGGGEAAPASTVATTPAEQHSASQAALVSAPALDVGGQLIHPGVVHANIASALSSLPTPLLAVLAALLAGLLLAGGGTLRNRVRDRSPD